MRFNKEDAKFDEIYNKFEEQDTKLEQITGKVEEKFSQHNKAIKTTFAKHDSKIQIIEIKSD